MNALQQNNLTPTDYSQLPGPTYDDPCHCFGAVPVFVLTWPACLPQSHAIKTPSAIYCSGQIPCDAEGNLVEGTIQEKTAACIKNLEAVLKTAGSGIEKVVKVNIFITDMGNFAVSHDRLSLLSTTQPRLSSCRARRVSAKRAACEC